ncbi:hypothetical protein [Phormidium sp. FACHB-1136]|uniref:hypothetical protein n=1 Tax=Phormidium sp. FACHB-1136 TaxID=2692848 RepID=UPI0016864FD1|nr:hypothetical protein [Phormidium sp. FACHB-1136]MBD2428879.1 hypothetical protein [Phormidium sp. FACHB-1136]
MNDSRPQGRERKKSNAPRRRRHRLSQHPFQLGSEGKITIQLKARYQDYQADGAITESTVNLILVPPLLERLGLCDPPYKIQGEQFVRFQIEDGDTLLEGLIDVLVVQSGLWLVLLESTRYGFSVMQALPQTLAYMMGNPEAQAPIFGLITTGEDYLFVK